MRMPGVRVAPSLAAAFCGAALGLSGIVACSSSGSHGAVGSDGGAADGDAPRPDGAPDDASPPFDGSSSPDGGAPGDAHSLGSCTAQQEGTGCSLQPNDDYAGICCGGTCIALPDDGNCGECGYACTAPATCVGYGFQQVSCSVVTPCGDLHPAGTDAGPAPLCSGDAGYGTCCGDSCVVAAIGEGQTDPLNCGGCGIACAVGETCQNGTCTAGGVMYACNGQGGPETQCPQGYACAGVTCAATSCGPDQVNQPVVLPDGGSGICCGASGVSTGTCR
jgi:hypothetical protein